MKVAGVGDPVASCDGPYTAIPDDTTAILPTSSIQMPWGLLSVASEPTVAELRVTAGVGAPVTRLAFANPATVEVPLLVAHSVSDESKTTPQGAWIVAPPASLTVASATSCGVAVPVSGIAGMCAFDISTIVVPAVAVVPLLATHMLPLLSNATPDAPLNCDEVISNTGPTALVPVLLSCACV